MPKTDKWTGPAVDEEADGTLERDILAMDAEAGSGVRMCHEQRKTAVYLSEDGRHIVEQEAAGAVRRHPLGTLPGGST